MSPSLIGVLAVTRLIATALAFGASSFTASAQPPEAPAAQPEMRENCPGLVATGRPPVTPAAFRLAALNEDQVRLTFIGHASFLIESPQLVRIVTDYNDYLRPPAVPDIVTMNHAHDTHFTDHPDPEIKYVLRGWGPSPEQPAIWDLKYRDVRVRNVPTNIRDFGGGTERYGNSIFIFEIANMCIAHLGHLHHTLTQQRGLQFRNICAQGVLLKGTAADVVVQESRKSGFALFAIVVNVRDDHAGLQGT